MHKYEFDMNLTTFFRSLRNSFVLFCDRLWHASICLFYHKFGGTPSPLDYENVRKTNYNHSAARARSVLERPHVGKHGQGQVGRYLLEGDGEPNSFIAALDSPGRGHFT